MGEFKLIWNKFPLFMEIFAAFKGNLGCKLVRMGYESPPIPGSQTLN